MSDKPLEEFVIALAGPAVNVVIAIVLFAALVPVALLRPDWFLSAFAVQATVALLGLNVLMVLFNLLPAFPMDGGRVLRALLAAGLGHYQATVIAVNVGSVVAVLMGLAGALFLGNWMLVAIAVFVMLVGRQELAVARRRELQRIQEQEPLPVLPVLPVRPVAPAVAPASLPVLWLQPKISVYTWDQHTGLWRKDPASSN